MDGEHLFPMAKMAGKFVAKSACEKFHDHASFHALRAEMAFEAGISVL